MRTVLFVAPLTVAWLMGCAPHSSQLSDRGIEHIGATYQGASDALAWARARRLLELTDQEHIVLDALRATATEEQRVPLLVALAHVQQAVNQCLVPSCAGTLANHAFTPQVVTVFDPGNVVCRQVPGPILLQPGEARSLTLEPGVAHRFVFQPTGGLGHAGVHQQTRPPLDGEPWFVFAHN